MNAQEFEDLMAESARRYRENVLYLAKVLAPDGVWPGQPTYTRDELRQLLAQQPPEFFEQEAMVAPERALREAQLLEGM